MDAIEIIQAIRDAESQLDSEKSDARTTHEIAGKLGLSVSTTRIKIKELLADGKLEAVWVKRRSLMDGRVREVPAFRPCPE